MLLYDCIIFKVSLLIKNLKVNDFEILLVGKCFAQSEVLNIILYSRAPHDYSPAPAFRQHHCLNVFLSSKNQGNFENTNDASGLAYFIESRRFKRKAPFLL